MDDSADDSTKANDSHALMGRAADRYNRGDLAGAEALCRQILGKAPRHPDALHLLALVAGRVDRLADAEDLLARAVAESPGNHDARRELARVRLAAGRPEHALELLEEVTRERPDDALAHYQLALAAKQLGRAERALKAYDAYCRLTPTNAEGPALVADLLQRLNRLEEASLRARQALAIDPHHPIATVVLAQTELRRGHGDPQEVLERLDRVLDGDLPPNYRAIALAWSGQALDRLGRLDEAMARFSLANDALGQSEPSPSEAGVYGRHTLERVRRFVESADPEGFVSTPDDGLPDPLFVVGFPRSGTTLVERMLAAHPGTAVLDERDTLLDLHRDFTLAVEGSGALASLDTAAVGRYRRCYWDRARGFGVEPTDRRLVIDKMPMNLIFMALIHRLFPTARFLFLIRDPRDVCLSCFMQTFEVNSATRHFLDLADTAAYYDQCMALATLSRQRLPMPVEVLRYEDLVGNVEAETRRILDFAGLPWVDGVLRFHEASRGHLTQTPSYRQVSEPVYSNSVGRWKRYERWLEPALPMLRSWVRALGYA